MCNAYALAGDHLIEGGNNHAGGAYYYSFHVRNLPQIHLYVNWQVNMFCYLIYLHHAGLHYLDFTSDRHIGIYYIMKAKHNHCLSKITGPGPNTSNSSSGL